MIDQTPLYFLSDHVIFFMSMFGLIALVILLFIDAVTMKGPKDE